MRVNFVVSFIGPGKLTKVELFWPGYAVWINQG